LLGAITREVQRLEHLSEEYLRVARLPQPRMESEDVAAKVREVVAFAKPDAEGHDEIAGPGNGLIGVFSTSGKLIRWFEHVDALNAPWGLALAPYDFGSFSHHLISGQFGSGELLAFNIETGEFDGNLLTPGGQPIVIDGLWGIGFGNGNVAGPANNLFFAAGPNDEANGLFGVLTPVTADLIQGNGN
jgi:uncharacterized protein (TIGR03118 family)